MCVLGYLVGRLFAVRFGVRVVDVDYPIFNVYLTHQNIKISVQQRLVDFATNWTVYFKGTNNNISRNEQKVKVSI